ncbi:hypothetical protein ACHQM5_008661 [Ranunculus cassubicifolius]
MTVKGGTSQACAACKYQRRKCASDCQLAPFFPPDQPKMFQNAHRLYGVSNILKIINQLNPSQKVEAMKSIIYQSNIRERYPVHGCVGVLTYLQQQIHQTQLELDAVTAQLNVYRQMPSSSPQPSYSPSSHMQQLQLESDTKSVLPLFNPQPYNSIQVAKSNSSPPYQSFSSENNIGYNGNYIDTKENSLWLHHQYNNNSSSNLVATQNQMFGSQGFPVQQPAEVLQDYDEISPAFYDIDDRQSFIDSKEPYESSSESSIRDTKNSIEHVAENELKDAAARFSLTSIN